MLCIIQIIVLCITLLNTFPVFKQEKQLGLFLILIAQAYIYSTLAIAIADGGKTRIPHPHWLLYCPAFHAKIARNFCVSRRPAKLNVKSNLRFCPEGKIG
jgi:hypothetical protein